VSHNEGKGYIALTEGKKRGGRERGEEKKENEHTQVSKLSVSGSRTAYAFYTGEGEGGRE